MRFYQKYKDTKDDQLKRGGYCNNEFVNQELTVASWRIERLVILLTIDGCNLIILMVRPYTIT